MQCHKRITKMSAFYYCTDYTLVQWLSTKIGDLQLMNKVFDQNKVFMYVDLPFMDYLNIQLEP